nr:reverse transcriptase domain-containing protein [Tanacetum cinerariifolium]
MDGQAPPQGSLPDLRSMEELLQAPTDGVGDAIVVPPVLANQFEIKIGSSPDMALKEPPNSITTCNDLVSKFVNRIFPPSKTTNLQNEIMRFQQRFERPQGVLLSNTVPNPREDIKFITTQSGVTLPRLSVPHPPLSSSKEVEQESETTTDQVLTESTTRVPPTSTSSKLPPAHKSSVVVPEQNPHQPPIPYPLSFAKALAHMPKFSKMVRDLLTNKEKLLELENTPLNENCSAVLLKKLPENLRDTRRFLIPCDFYGLESCMALADLGASINLMPIYVLLILERPALRTTHALVDVHGEELTLRVGDEKLVLDEIDTFLASDDSTSPDVEDKTFDMEGDPPDLELKDLPHHLKYFQIPIGPQDQEKITFTCPYGTFAYRRMPFDLCNAPGTFQRCMVAIFHDMIRKTMEVSMDAFLVFGDSFSSCLSHLDMMLKWCKDTNLVLNWEKCYFMVKEGIVHGYKIFKSDIKGDRAKVDMIAKLPPLTTVKGIRRFLGHAAFYRRFIQDFSKIARPMTHLLEKYTPFFFSSEC